VGIGHLKTFHRAYFRLRLMKLRENFPRITCISTLAESYLGKRPQVVQKCVPLLVILENIAAMI
jgi:hypothetical protein